MVHGVTAYITQDVDEDQVEFEVRCHPRVDSPFVVLVLGSQWTTLHISNPAQLVALGQVVAEAHDLLTAALAGQDPLPVEPIAVPA